MNYSELTKLVAVKTSKPVDEVENILDMFLAAISECLADDEDVLISRFGKFELRHKQAGIKRNPKTGDPVNVPSKRTIGFRVSGVLKGKLNGRLDNR